MMIEREITDVLQVTVATFILSLILVSDNSEIKGNVLLFVGLIMIILGTFTHIILVQLEVLNLLHSKYFSYLGLVSTFITIVGYFQYEKSEIDGFWDDIGLSYNFIFNFSVIMLVVSSIITPGTKRATIM